jgi:hypothetical protein
MRASMASADIYIHRAIHQHQGATLMRQTNHAGHVDQRLDSPAAARRQTAPHPLLILRGPTER